jgi:GntR family transcriptional regulator, rspAB operon transcriptional repressor
LKQNRDLGRKTAPRLAPRERDRPTLSAARLPEREAPPRPESLGARVYKVVRERILTGAFAPGAILDEMAIATEFKISRTPVREAIKRLADENLVEVKAQSRTLVKLFDRHLIHEAYLIRRALEIENVGHAAKRVAEVDLHALEDALVLHQAALLRRRFSDAIELDDSFHRRISEISGLPRLWRAVEVSKAHLDRCRYFTVPEPGAGEATLAQHRAIIAALSQRNPRLAQKMMAEHLDKAYQGIEAFLDRIEAEKAP